MLQLCTDSGLIDGYGMMTFESVVSELQQFIEPLP